MKLVTFLPVDSKPKQSIAKEHHESNKAKSTISSSVTNPVDFQQLLNAGLVQDSPKSKEMQNKLHSSIIPNEKVDAIPAEVVNAKHTEKHSIRNMEHQQQGSVSEVNHTKKKFDPTAATSQQLAGAMAVSQPNHIIANPSKTNHHSDKSSLLVEPVQADNTTKASLINNKVNEHIKSDTLNQPRNIELPVQASKINVENRKLQATVNVAETVRSAPIAQKQESTPQSLRVKSQVPATQPPQPQHVLAANVAKVLNTGEAKVVQNAPIAQKQESMPQSVRVKSQVPATQPPQPQHVQAANVAKVLNAGEAKVVQNAQNIPMTPIINEVIYGDTSNATNKPSNNKVKLVPNSSANPTKAQNKYNAMLNLQTINSSQAIIRGKSLLTSRVFFSKNTNKNSSPNSTATPPATNLMNQTMINFLVNNHFGSQSSDTGKQGQSSITNSNVTTNPFTMPFIDSSNLQTLNSDLSKWVIAQSSRLSFVGASSIVMTLVPEHLGKVKLTVKNDKNGHLQVKLAASNTEALNLLTNNAQTLQQQLEANGFGSVTINFGMDQQANQGALSDGNNAGTVMNESNAAKPINDSLLVQAGKNYSLQDLHQGFIAEA